MSATSSKSIGDILLRGSDVLKSYPDFALVGRSQELRELTTILMKMKKRNLIVTGRGGVGISSVLLGIQDSKRSLDTPVDIVGKRMFWLVTDKLFESGVSQLINELFERVRQTLSRTADAVVVIEDADDFLKAARENGCTNLINGLMGDIKLSRFQAIFEVKDESVGELLKCDGDISEFCTLYEIREPSPENLRLILQEAKRGLEKHHGVRVSAAALEIAASLTEKYKIPELRAQPDASISLLDLAMTDCCRDAHAKPQQLLRIEHELNRPGLSVERQGELRGQLEQERLIWNTRQQEVRVLYKDMTEGEEQIRKHEDEISMLRDLQMQNAAVVESQGKAGSTQLGAFASVMAQGNLDTERMSELKKKVVALDALVQRARSEYRAKVAAVYAGLEVGEAQVLSSFSTLSGIPLDKLSEDERVKLRNLESVLAKRVVGQQEPTSEVAKAVMRARLGLKMPNKPSGTFMFLGPSGVGKTELAKALAESLGVPLIRFDMSEYMEKHAVAKLIGAPPGYEGYEHGGILTNAVRKNPYSVVLFDEIEKAHSDVFNLMLQLLDDARLTDSRGLTASFKDTIIIMTTNIGTGHFLNEEIPFPEAKELAFADLREQYRPEFLGRFGGNIYCFMRLAMEVLEAIATKDISRINKLIAPQKLHLEMAELDLRRMIADRYVPREGARSILGYIDRNITSGIAELVLADTPHQGTVYVFYDGEARRVRLSRERA